MRCVPVIALALLGGCASDSLYTYCTDGAQCGSHYYDRGAETFEVPLECVEATVALASGETTRGNLCTLPCESDLDCDSAIGLPNGLCIRFAGDDAFYCYQRCDADPCYPSSRCETVTVDDGDARVCLPVTTPA